MPWCNDEENADANGKVGLLLIVSSNDKAVVAGFGFSKVVLFVVVVEDENDRRPDSNGRSDCPRSGLLFAGEHDRARTPRNDDSSIIDESPVASLFDRVIVLLLWQKRRLLLLAETAELQVVLPLILVGETNSTAASQQ